MAWTKTYTGAEPLRINKWLAMEGVCSRREADALIEKGLISIDGQKVTQQGERIVAGQTLSLAQKAARQLDSQLSIMFHKPVGIVSGTPEEGEIPAIRLITAETLSGKSQAIPGRYNKFAPLGRLDKDSRGLLILSEDGVLAKALIGPLSELDKEYIVKVNGDVTEAAMAKLRHGMELDGRQLKPAIVEKTNVREMRFILREGRNRQIRRMCQLVDLRVVDLMRVRIGPLELAGLPEGKWRPLSSRERDALLNAEAPRSRTARPERNEDGGARPPRREADGPKSRRPDKPGARPGKPAPRQASKDTPAPGPTISPLKGEKFKRTKLAPRKRSPIK